MIWELVTELQIHGKPRPQPRAKARVVSGRAFIYTPSSAKEWKLAVQSAFEEVVYHSPLEQLRGPVKLTVDFFLPRPQRLCRKADPDETVWHICTPDLDNLEKAVMDAITYSKLWKDDCQVCDKRSRKFYHSKSGKPGIRIKVEVLQ